MTTSTEIKRSAFDKINKLTEELQNIENKVNKLLQGTIGSSEIDFNRKQENSYRISILMERRKNIKEEIMDNVEILNREEGIDWDGKPLNNLFENLDKPILDHEI